MEYLSPGPDPRMFFSSHKINARVVSISDVDFKMSSVDFVHFVEGSEALLLFKTDNHLPTI